MAGAFGNETNPIMPLVSGALGDISNLRAIKNARLEQDVGGLGWAAPIAKTRAYKARNPLVGALHGSMTNYFNPETQQKVKMAKAAKEMKEWMATEGLDPVKDREAILMKTYEVGQKYELPEISEKAYQQYETERAASVKEGQSERRLTLEEETLDQRAKEHEEELTLKKERYELDKLRLESDNDWRNFQKKLESFEAMSDYEKNQLIVEKLRKETDTMGKGQDQILIESIANQKNPATQKILLDLIGSKIAKNKGTGTTSKPYSASMHKQMTADFAGFLEQAAKEGATGFLNMDKPDAIDSESERSALAAEMSYMSSDLEAQGYDRVTATAIVKGMMTGQDVSGMMGVEAPAPTTEGWDNILMQHKGTGNESLAIKQYNEQFGEGAAEAKLGYTSQAASEPPQATKPQDTKQQVGLPTNPPKKTVDPTSLEGGEVLQQVSEMLRGVNVTPEMGKKAGKIMELAGELKNLQTKRAQPEYKFSPKRLEALNKRIEALQKKLAKEI